MKRKKMKQSWKWNRKKIENETRKKLKTKHEKNWDKIENETKKKLKQNWKWNIFKFSSSFLPPCRRFDGLSRPSQLLHQLHPLLHHVASISRNFRPNFHSKHNSASNSSKSRVEWRDGRPSDAFEGKWRNSNGFGRQSRLRSAGSDSSDATLARDEEVASEVEEGESWRNHFQRELRWCYKKALKCLFTVRVLKCGWKASKFFFGKVEKKIVKI